MLAFIATLVLFLIPTSMLGLYVALGLQDISLPARSLILYGTLGGLIDAAFRALPWRLGFHALLMALTMIMLVRYVSKRTWGMAVLGALVCQIAIAIGEGLISVPVLSMMDVTLHDQSVWLTLLGGWLSNILLILLALMIHLRVRRRRAIHL